ncbi:MAG: alpha-hydroxy-acid oxidizing protein [Dehalococcoidia bacterium]|nr:alpha-hydroxy-acid oxidizing protein [Dehalococcoidia bacterium]
MTVDFVTNEEIIQAARRNLDQGPWDYLVGGSESETTMRRNRLAFDRLAFRPRVLVDVSSTDPSTTFLGHPMRIPVMLAPIGSLQVFAPEGGCASAQAAAEFGTVQVVSSVTEPSLEEIAAGADGPKVFQLYVHGDWDWTKDIVGRVKQAGYSALCLTVDTARYSRRERQMLSRWTPPTRRRPWDPTHAASLTWEKMARIKDFAGLPFILKGVATREDALLAVEHGIDVIWVSNHGGRQLDHGRGTMDMLADIVQAAGGRARIVLDGGIQRGSDVAKALALGADAVAIGRLQAWGLAAAGRAGVVRVLEILEDELLIAMALLGVTSVDRLTPEYVCQADAVTAAHEMSAWVNKPVDRIL